MSSPISIAEFAAALRRCLPALPRPVVAVANSAGPDSTCLLFLLRQLFPPSALLSIHVLHDLQPASPDMATAAAANAIALGIPHHSAHIPWGVPPFPPSPAGSSLERVARDARYNVFFRALTCTRIPLLALGHHADDQLETAILRLARGSSLLGAAGMRPLRRWGMGSHSPLASFAHLGLNAFILRPLLPFPKDRILATCHVNHLRYIDDPTNSQSHLTPRNAIRQCLHHDPPFSQPVSFPPSLSFTKAKDACALLQSNGSDDITGTQRLYSAAIKLATAAEYVDRKVTSHLTQCVLPSPTGTLLLSPTKLLDIVDPDVRIALVLRVIRYVSFHPWGSLRADADRRRNSIHRIIRALWADPCSLELNKFTAGGGVLWSPVVFNPNKSLRARDQRSHASLQSDDHPCWLASRVPPFFKNPQQGTGSPARLSVDLTKQLRAAIFSNMPSVPFQILYDCRFLLCIDAYQMPTHVKSALEQHGASIKVLPFTQYYLPKVVLQHESYPDQVLAVPQERDPRHATAWISIRWIRPLDAI